MDATDNTYMGTLDLTIRATLPNGVYSDFSTSLEVLDFCNLEPLTGVDQTNIDFTSGTGPTTFSLSAFTIASGCESTVTYSLEYLSFTDVIVPIASVGDPVSTTSSDAIYWSGLDLIV